jgi:hypothetical protein
MDDGAKTLLTALLSGGGVGLVTAIFKGLSALRSGVRAEERDSVRDLGRERRAARADARYYATACATYARQLRAAGIEPVPAELVPPSERNSNGLTSHVTEVRMPEDGNGGA